MRARHLTFLCALALAAIALIGAGCGSSDDSTTSTAAATTSTAASAGGGRQATIDVADNSEIGPILADGNGNTVYLFEKDEGDESYCNDADCVAAWPPVTTSGDPTAGKGVDQSLLGTIQREDGSEQVTYDGHPLYLYAGDAKPGDTAGNGLDQFGAEWYALTPSGDAAEDSGEGSGDDDSASEDSTGEDSTSTETTTTSSGSIY